MSGKNKVLITTSIIMVVLMLNTSNGENYSPDSKISTNMAVTTTYPIKDGGNVASEVTLTPKVTVTAASQAVAAEIKTTVPENTTVIPTIPPRATAGFESIPAIAMLSLIYIYKKK